MTKLIITQLIQELLILFWKLIDENKEFLSYILRAGDINELVWFTKLN